LTVAKIYSVAPANVYTGGPTALHQLCYFINRFFDVECLMAYTGITREIDPVHHEYKKYMIPYVSISKVEDNPNYLLVLPETQTQLIRRFRRSKKAIYWLAVDNFFLSNYYRSRASRIRFWLDFIEYMLRSKSIPLISYYKFFLNDVTYYIALKEISKAASKYVQNPLKDLIDNVDIHIAQSIYAKKFLIHIGVDQHKIPVIREPIEEEFYNISLTIKNKYDIISFNARKTFSKIYHILQKISKHYKSLKIIPLRNVGKEGMKKILSRSKVFIDIGHHPGRDRPAREAGILRNIVIINRSGGYYYPEDLPVPEEYTIHCRDIACRDINERDLTELVIDSVENYEYHINKFSNFIEYLKEEPKLYLEDLKRFVSLVEQL